LFWKQKTGISIQGYSATRWWSKWEVINQTFELFGDVECFIRQDEFSSSTRAKLTEFFTDQQKLDCLKVEFAAIVDAGKQFVQATYKLEGDSPLVLRSDKCIEHICCDGELL